ncbi:alpha-amylase family protein [Halomarina litorea]|uniref:alpha-amylase family protein n=1 Tax=Halomarina litorea TaxID=2961595 RepID=UPI0020C4FD8A|nr:alpha-amylase family protein [Halomarina sp. BCD28]
MTVSRGARWFENAVIYAIDVEAFQDSDGDGVGDFEGLTERLDYLDRLGVDCLWLLPFYDTPNRDNGYDVRDYYAVDSRLGTLGDVVEFLQAAEERGIRVIVDLVVNHTSTEHPWFQRAREAPDSKYRDYYVWTDDPSEAPEWGSVFPGEVEDDRVWTYDEAADAYYFHRFYPFQPDLDLQNPDVREEIHKIVDFWLELGVDGFRIDAATLMIQQKRPGEPEMDDPHAILRELRANAARTNGEVVLLAEADDDPEDLVTYFGGHRLPGSVLEGDGGSSDPDAAAETGEEMDLLLNFVLNAHLFGALATETATPLKRCLTDLAEATEAGQWANFLRNYDELNLGRLPPEDQRVVFDRFAPDEDMRIYGRGIRRRLAPMLDGDRDRLKQAFSLVFSMPGTPLVLYGDELGMGEALDVPGRGAVRTPMQWTDGPNAGFSSASSESLVAPVVDGAFGPDRVNAADQWTDPDSLLRFVQELVGVRKSCPAVGSGRLTLLDTDDPATFAHRFDHEGRTVVVVHNLGADPRTVRLDLPDADGGSLRVLLGDPAIGGDGSPTVDLDGYGFAWLRVGEDGASAGPT